MGYGVEDAAPQSFIGQFRNSVDEVEPEEEVGVKWRWNRGCLSSHCGFVFVGGVVVQDQVDCRSLGT